MQPQLGPQELAQVCSHFALNERFEPRLNLVRFTRHKKPKGSTWNLRNKILSFSALTLEMLAGV